jgi:DNA-binding GntR family transcriptional regulator
MMQLDLTTNDRVTLADKAYQSLREQILSGKLQGGTRLRQHELARQLKITTNPLREALIRLERDGLVESEPSLGAKVREWKPEDFIKQFDVRIALESELAMLAAERISSLELKELASLSHVWDSRVLHSVDGSMPGYDADVEIHHSIARASRSEKLMQLWHIAILQPKQNRPASFWEEHVKHCQPWSHMLLVKAIASRDPEISRLAARRHVAFSRAIMVRAMGLEWQFPQYADDGIPVAAEEEDFKDLLGN